MIAGDGTAVRPTGRSAALSTTPDVTFAAAHALAQAGVGVRLFTVQVLGTINALDVEGHFTPDRARRLEALVAARRPALLAAMDAARKAG